VTATALCVAASWAVVAQDPPCPDIAVRVEPVSRRNVAGDWIAMLAFVRNRMDVPVRVREPRMAWLSLRLMSIREGREKLVIESGFAGSGPPIPPEMMEIGAGREEARTFDLEDQLPLRSWLLPGVYVLHGTYLFRAESGDRRVIGVLQIPPVGITVVPPPENERVPLELLQKGKQLVSHGRRVDAMAPLRRLLREFPDTRYAQQARVTLLEGLRSVALNDRTPGALEEFLDACENLQPGQGLTWRRTENFWRSAAQACRNLDRKRAIALLKRCTQTDSVRMELHRLEVYPHR
jgi:hypothetical protein